MPTYYGQLMSAGKLLKIKFLYQNCIYGRVQRSPLAEVVGGT